LITKPEALILRKELLKYKLKTCFSDGY
jgi:hypothetical protein